jgi:hypothetical protein
MARSTVQAKSKNYWGPIELARLVLFFVWWPGEFGPGLDDPGIGGTDDSTCVLDGTYVQIEEQGDAKGSNLGLKEDQLGPKWWGRIVRISGWDVGGIGILCDKSEGGPQYQHISCEERACLSYVLHAEWKIYSVDRL